MGLLDEIRDDTSQIRGRRIDAIAAQLPEGDRDEFYEAMRDTSIASVSIVRALRKRGIEVTEEQVRGYRRRMRDVVR